MQAIRFLLGVILFNVGPTLLEFALVIGILLHQYPWYFALVTFLTIVTYAGFTFVASEWRIAIRREMNARDNEVSAQTVDSLLNYETVKAFTNESLEGDRLDRTLALYERAAIQSETSLAALNFGQAAIIAIGVTVIMVLAAQGVVAGTLTVGDIVLLNGFLLQLYQPLNFLGVVYRQVRQSLTDLESLMGLLDLEPEIEDRADARPLALAGGEVRFEEVTFGYDPRRPILHDLSFAIPAGQTLAVVGSSGAGKSTLVRLLFRFYDVDAGPHPDRRPGSARAHPGHPCAPRSGSCRRTPCCSTTRSAPTSPMAAPARRRTRSRPRRARPRSTTSSRACPTATRPWSASAASSSRAARSSASRSRAWCSRTRRSWCSTRRPRRSIPTPSA